MNIETLIEKYKCNKIGHPISVLEIADIDTDIFNSVRKKITDTYDLSTDVYATEEKVFYNTRRIVAKTKYIKTNKQLYTSMDFDNSLMEIIQPLIDAVKVILPNSNPSLIQIATILPEQKLRWHVDTFLYQQFSNKIHIPLFSNLQSFYDVLINGRVKRTNMTEGKIWNINNLDLHRSINLGNTIRSHLIMDFIDNDTLSVLDESGINYFHHRLDFMSEKESRQMDELKSNYN